MESDLSGLRNESDLELSGQMGQIVSGFHLLRTFNKLAICHEDTKTRRHQEMLFLCDFVILWLRGDIGWTQTRLQYLIRR